MLADIPDATLSYQPNRLGVAISWQMDFSNESQKHETVSKTPDFRSRETSKHPIWETLVDDDADDPSVFPIDTLPVTDLTGRLVGTRVKLANGDRLWAMLFNLDLKDARKTDQLVQLRIERKGKWFWLARYWDVDYERSVPDALAAFLGLSRGRNFSDHLPLYGPCYWSSARRLRSVIKGASAAASKG